MQTITINGQSYGLVSIPASPGPAAVEIGMNDLIALTESPYTRQQQTQQWPGGDWWDAKITLPPMTTANAAAWEGFLAELRGPLNVFELADPRHLKPLGNVMGSAPKVSGTNAATATTLTTNGWQPGRARVLLRGDRFQLGYRLYMACEDVSADQSGNATIQVWPSLREDPGAGTALIVNAPKGLFRLPQGRRSLQASPARATTMSFDCYEVR